MQRCNWKVVGEEEEKEWRYANTSITMLPVFQEEEKEKAAELARKKARGPGRREKAIIAPCRERAGGRAPIQPL